MPEASQRHSGPAGPRSAFQRPPLWLRWVLSILVASALLVALVRFVDSNGSSSQQATVSPAAAAQENQEAETLVSQDQAPHTVRLSRGANPADALTRAVRADMVGLIAHGELDGPLSRSSCTLIRTRAGSQAFRCAAIADGLTYPFLGVVDVPAGLVTYCKRDPPPIPSDNIPVSSRCQP